jgi:hypothetical protein
MVKRYLHIEVSINQRPKRFGQVCGDVVSVTRNDTVTTAVVCDGVGSGTAAHVAARMCQSRLERLLEEGFSLREAFLCVAASMEQWKQPGKPYAAFTIVQIRSDGAAVILSYESPQAIWITSQQAMVLPQRILQIDGICAHESTCYLGIGESLLLMTDGITQSGVEMMPGGWQSKGVAEYLSGLLAKKQMNNPAQQVQSKAAMINGDIDYDDATAVWMRCRQGRVLSLWTGPPAEKLMDMATVEQFMTMPGTKVICGATTSAIAARMLGREVQIEPEPTSLIAPPKYFLDGIDLVTEGAVTLNQLNNVLELQPEDLQEISAVTELYDLLAAADRIHILLGMGKNPANNDTCFVQRGVLSREKIIPLIAQKLRQQGKCVVIETM